MQPKEGELTLYIARYTYVMDWQEVVLNTWSGQEEFRINLPVDPRSLACRAKSPMEARDIFISRHEPHIEHCMYKMQCSGLLRLDLYPMSIFQPNISIPIWHRRYDGLSAFIVHYPDK